MNDTTDSQEDPKFPNVRPKRGRKRKSMNLTRAENKKAKNTNKTHYDYKRRILVEKKLDETFQCSCSKKCCTAISLAQRQQCFKKFWELGSYDAQTTYIGALVKEYDKKRTYGMGKRPKKFSRNYQLDGVLVCRETFIKTLCISTKRVNSALMKLRSKSITDKRGQAQGGQNKIDQRREQEVINQINQIPRYKSHYRRYQCSDAEFLPPEMTLSLMYRKYNEEIENAVSFQTYRRIFLTKFNLKFKKLKKDTCNTCDTYQSKIHNALTANEKEKLKEDHENHIKNWQEARNQMKNDMKKAKDNENIECLTFDLEKTLPLPRLATGILFYKRQIWLYNLGIHSGSTNKGHFYVWTENEAGRGAQEIASCLTKHIKENISDKTTELTLWSDSCGGQNRNIKMTLMLKAVLSHSSLKIIRMRFLVSGHSFLPNDSDFSDVECALKHQQRLYLPEDYIRIMEECRTKNKFKVSRMLSSEFYGTAELEKQIVNRKVDVGNKKISWLKTREILLDKEKPFSIFLRTNFDDDSDYAEIDIRKKQLGRPAMFKDLLMPMWLKGKKISNPKLVDIKSVMHLIPNDCKQFYENITGTDIMDDVDGFSGAPDFEVEPSAE